MLITMTVFFIIGFDIGPGPILWLYMSEICNNKATSVNTLVQWLWSLSVSLATPVIFEAIEGYLWLVYCIASTIGLIYMFIFMKETRNIPKDKVKRLYYSKMK